VKEDGGTNMNTAECVECGAQVEIAQDVMQGEIITCGDCGVELEVVSVSPVRLELAPMEMEDWGE
jgi:alpha-aminoadipate/glutamate carrier protein LysW